MPRCPDLPGGRPSGRCGHAAAGDLDITPGGVVQMPVQIRRLEVHIGTRLVHIGRFRRRKEVGQLTNRAFDAVPGTFDTPFDTLPKPQAAKSAG